MSDEGTVPDGWRSTTLGEIGRYINGRGFKTSEWSSKGRPIIRIQDLTGSNRNPHYFHGTVEDRYVVQPGDFLISWSATLGAYIWDGPEALLNQHIFRVESKIDKRFHYHLVRDRIADLMRNAHGSGMVHVTKGIFDATSVVIPEDDGVQRQIADLIDRADEWEASAAGHISLARRAVERFRQAVLRAACSGQLTTKWRNEHPSVSSESLRSTTEQRSRLRAIASFDLDRIPVEWRWAQVDDVLPPGGIFDGPFGSNLKTSDYTSDGARVIRLENVGHLRFLDEKRTYVSQTKYNDLRRHAVFPGDVIFSSFVDEQIRVCVLPANLDKRTLAKADCFTLRPAELVSSEYLALQLASMRTYGYLASDVHGATRPRVNTTQVRSLPIPLCCRAEQDEIVAAWSQATAIADAIEARIQRAQQCVERTEQTILSRLCSQERKVGVDTAE